MKELRIGNKSLIKDINIYLVLSVIRTHSPISRAEISKNTGLAQSTITNIVNKLSTEGLIKVIGDGKSTGGRKPIKLQMNYCYGYTIAIKIETTQIVIAICDLEPTIVETVRVSYDKKSKFDVVESILIDSLMKIKKQYQDEGKNILGVGITLSGIIDNTKNYLVNSSLLGWYDIDVKAKIEELFNFEVVIENDVNCFAQYHNDRGIGKDMSNFVCVTVGEGIGSGIIVNSELYKGYFGGAGEFGHQILHPEGKQCYCGQKGCLEMYVKEEVLVEQVNDINSLALSYNELFNNSSENHQAIITASQTTLKELSYGLINLIMHLNPQEIIVGVKPEYNFFDIQGTLEEFVSENWFNKKGHMNTQIRVSELMEDKFILGVASMVVEEIMKNPMFIGFKGLV